MAWRARCTQGDREILGLATSKGHYFISISLSLGYWKSTDGDDYIYVINILIKQSQRSLCVALNIIFMTHVVIYSDCISSQSRDKSRLIGTTLAKSNVTHYKVQPSTVVTCETSTKTQYLAQGYFVDFIGELYATSRSVYFAKQLQEFSGLYV